jgi:phosphoserine aminotransferase
MKSNTLNFSGGPGALPETVLEQTREAVARLPETGISVLGMSHRSDWFLSILNEVEQNLRSLLGISDDYAVTFLQGGSSLQFAMIPMNFATQASAPPEYVTSGYWSGRATSEAAKVTARKVAWDGRGRLLICTTCRTRPWRACNFLIVKMRCPCRLLRICHPIFCRSRSGRICSR